jgi:hypothetical protein
VTNVESKFCHLCGNALEGRGAIFRPFAGSGERGLAVCPDCMATLRCDTCGSLAVPPGTVLPDGRRVCSRCNRIAVYDEEDARAMFLQIQRELKNYCTDFYLNIATPLYLLDFVQHVEMIREVEPGITEEEAKKRLGFYARKGILRGIYVLSGLPRPLMKTVVAHEWAHAWHAEHMPFMPHSLVVEGFANWVAAKVLEFSGSSEDLKQIDVLKMSPDEYGQGLRMMLDIEKREGFDGVMRAIRQL